MVDRRGFFRGIVAFVALCFGYKPKPPETDSLGGFVVPPKFAPLIESGVSMHVQSTTCIAPRKSLKEVCAMRGVVYVANELAEDNRQNVLLKRFLQRDLMAKLKDSASA
jgi:hypothetical protein